MISKPKKKIVFLTGTRADYGKLKPLITATKKNKKFHLIIVITGMHLKKKYGSTYIQIEKDFSNTDIYKFYITIKMITWISFLQKQLSILDKL